MRGHPIRTAALVLCLITALLCTACQEKPVKQGMVTADGLTFIASTITDEKAGAVRVTVTVTNGTGGVLYLAAPEMATPDGTTAVYLDMALADAAGEFDTLPETGLTRWLCLDSRESYSETQTFTGTLPATLTVRVSAAPGYRDEFCETVAELPLK
ncbi:MAG: hypothetical protein IKD37_07670 [Clostridia bacterium]|nr:hypothetical protein [Clostridia bacterium]